jgi:hypothetical protein
MSQPAADAAAADAPIANAPHKVRDLKDRRLIEFPSSVPVGIKPIG